ncbi:MAG: hypothetical protein CVT88_00970 [Candidatus Altiarchaeales archaeon HGW-Altiarchaeales-1]|nr:MAG: hypothetical protein CVT88_00970 [Candidatus Altiarchaeales archaeon HGW-Altiarchaeales-1]
MLQIPFFIIFLIFTYYINSYSIYLILDIFNNDKQRKTKLEFSNYNFHNSNINGDFQCFLFI